MDNGGQVSGVSPVWVVAGAPGAGKSTVAALLAGLLDPAPAILDKDTMYGGFVAAALAAAGREHGEREGAWYDDHIKVHEYAGMTATAREIRAHGCAPMLVAPFTSQIRDPRRWARWVADLGGEPVRLVWVGCAVEVLRRRLLTRDRAQDSAKIAGFEAWTERMLPGTPPPVPHLAVDNSAEVPRSGGLGDAGGAADGPGAAGGDGGGAADLTRRLRAIAELEGVRPGR